MRSSFRAGRIPHVKVAPAYRNGLALVALAMVLLPLIYLALIGATAWGVWLYATNATVLFENAHGRHLILCFLLYATPLLAGVTVVFFMFKPLLARRSGGPQPHVLIPGQHPLLEDFVGRPWNFLSRRQPIWTSPFYLCLVMGMTYQECPPHESVPNFDF